MKVLKRAVNLVLFGLIKLYQWIFRPLLGQNCRFFPSCSDYAREALETHGPFYGTWLALSRIVRCNPWSSGGPDPVPPKRGPDLT